ncbi:MAG: 50S ribosomal protein L5 [bacterium]
MSTDTEELRELWLEKRDKIQDKLGLDNVEAVPRLEKIVVNVGIGDASENIKRLEVIQEHLRRITGQQPQVTRARKSVAGFDIRQGEPAGLKVTLRGKKMDDFLRRLVHIALPRTKDFRGLDLDGFDHHGNYSLGVDDQGVFPEISYDEIEQNFGMDITIVTTGKSPEKSRVLLEEYDFPFAG